MWDQGLGKPTWSGALPQLENTGLRNSGKTENIQTRKQTTNITCRKGMKIRKKKISGLKHHTEWERAWADSRITVLDDVSRTWACSVIANSSLEDLHGIIWHGGTHTITDCYRIHTRVYRDLVQCKRDVMNLTQAVRWNYFFRGGICCGMALMAYGYDTTFRKVWRAWNYFLLYHSSVGKLD